MSTFSKPPPKSVHINMFTKTKNVMKIINIRLKNWSKWESTLFTADPPPPPKCNHLCIVEKDCIFERLLNWVIEVGSSWGLPVVQSWSYFTGDQRWRVRILVAAKKLSYCLNITLSNGISRFPPSHGVVSDDWILILIRLRLYILECQVQQRQLTILQVQEIIYVL